MSTPFYVSPEQWYQDKAEYARKGIARGRPIERVPFKKAALPDANDLRQSFCPSQKIVDLPGQRHADPGRLPKLAGGRRPNPVDVAKGHDQGLLLCRADPGDIVQEGPQVLFFLYASVI